MSQTSINPFNHDVAAPDAVTVSVNYNGTWIQVPKGRNVVEVARSQGDFLPHFCYHEKLSVSGNCRLCLFEMGAPKLGPDRKPVIGADGHPELNWLPRPQIGCATNVSDGMGIRTNSPLAVDCRRDVLEFLLINHPLDCPICDQAGECKLQEFASAYGRGESRFVEDKITKPKHFDLGKNLIIDDERCILCTRCIRFAREVLHDDALGIVNRGGHNTVTCHPDQRFDNEYSLNAADLCPVGALTSKDFRFKMRVWFLKETKSICVGCGTGCNVTIGSREQTVYRLTPRHNAAVNSQWLCDTGRLDIHYLSAPNRFTNPSVRVRGELYATAWDDTLRQAGRRLRSFAGSQIALLASARMTNEELFLSKTIADELGVTVSAIVPRAGQGDNFLRSADLNPNSVGARLLGFTADADGGLTAVRDGVRSGQIKALLVWHEDVTVSGLTTAELAKLDLIIYVGLSPNTTTGLAHFILPAAGFAEKHGTMVSVSGRLQRLNPACPPPGQAREDVAILAGLRAAATDGAGLATSAEIFAAIANQVPAFAGLTLEQVGDLGAPLTV
ncbi:MAG: molybdopterin-dependent oxidoreductase [Verrucomicrobiales bacterium]|jgi:NADH-quinone oxidoreductase subunit G|nr:molybdopterin-dependent oxidoreductase [Verrucomicrobiales bacterium]